MNRLAIRKYVRFLINEFIEEPGSFIKDESEDEIDLNGLINVAQTKVELDLVPDIPHFFRKSALLSRTISKGIYDVVDDFSILDFLLFENIYHNAAGQRPRGLLYVTPDQVFAYGTVGEEGEPRIWTYQSDKSIALYPIPSSTLASAYRGDYFRKLPDLNQDTVHNPSGFTITAVTIAFVAATHKITDSGNGLAGFLTGDTILVSGSVANNGTYTVVTGGIAGYMVVAETLVDGTAGPSVTITGPGKYAIPDMPEPAHILIATRAVIEIQISKESGALDLMQLYAAQKADLLRLLSITPSLRTERRAPIGQATK